MYKKEDLLCMDEKVFPVNCPAQDAPTVTAEPEQPAQNIAMDAISLASEYITWARLSSSQYAAVGEFIEWLQAKQHQ